MFYKTTKLFLFVVLCSVFFYGGYFQVIMMSPRVWADEITHQEMNHLKAVFPEAANFNDEHLNLNSEQIVEIEKMIRGKISPKHKNPTLFKADSVDKTLGYIIFFDSKDPDGDIIPAAVGVRPDGTIAKVVVFTHHVDENPLVGDDFLKQFAGKKPADPEAWHPEHTVKLVAGKE